MHGFVIRTYQLFLRNQFARKNTFALILRINATINYFFVGLQFGAHFLACLSMLFKNYCFLVSVFFHWYQTIWIFFHNFQLCSVSCTIYQHAYCISLYIYIHTFADVRGEIARSEYNILVRLKKQVDCKKPDEQLVAVVQIQSGKASILLAIAHDSH